MIKSEHGLGMLNDVKKTLNDMEVPFKFISGTALGLCRQGTVLENDADIDVAVLNTIDIDSFKQKFSSYGYKQRSEMVVDGKLRIIGYEKHEMDIEIDFFDINDKYWWLTFENGGKPIYLVYPRNYWDKTDYLEYKGSGTYFPTPSPVEDFLTDTYGNWYEINPSYYKSDEAYFITGKKARLYEFDPTK